MTALIPFAATRLSPELQGELARRSHHLLFADLFTPIFADVPVGEAPDYIVLTSGQGVRAARALGLSEYPAYCVGPQTKALARAQGLEVSASEDPPAPRIVPHLPPAPKRGLWVSGAEVAHDLDCLSGPHILRRHVAYEMQVAPVLQNVIRPALAKDQIRSMFVTSIRMIRELAELLENVQANVQTHVQGGPSFCVALSDRLADAAVRALPMIGRTVVVDSLDSGVRTLLNDREPLPSAD